jgi:hypothetical protein
MHTLLKQSLQVILVFRDFLSERSTVPIICRGPCQVWFECLRLSAANSAGHCNISMAFDLLALRRYLFNI